MTRPAELCVLVLGVGGNVSQGILKALAVGSLRTRVVGACVDPMALGLYTVDRAYVSPFASDAGFIGWLIQVCRAESVQAILSGVEPVLTVLAENRVQIERESGAVPIVSSPDCLAIGNDKLATCRWLAEQGLNYPRYAPAEDRAAVESLVANRGFPLIAKPRQGKGAHGVIEVRDRAALDRLATDSGYVVQESLGDLRSEYTAGCFCDRDGGIRGAIVMRRQLLHGTTYQAELGEFPALRQEAIRIAAALRPVGPCNIQMRLADGRPVCFEINVRFSGTTPIRARLGFNEVEAALRHFVLGEAARDLPLVTEGLVLRYWNELYVDRSAHALLQRTGRLDDPHRFSVLLETYGEKS